MNTLHISAFGSLAVQLLTGVFELQGMFVPVRPEDEIVKDVLLMELVVQFVEFLFYVYLVYMIVSGHISTAITSHRYVDWSITTPVMLVSFVIFFKYLHQQGRTVRLLQSIQEELPNISQIVIGNALMLLFGFVSEVGLLSTPIGVALGFIPFAYIFKILYSYYARFTTLGNILFYLSFIIWGLYGVGAVLPFTYKNTVYNILDVFSKNAYGLFLYAFVQTKRIQR
jgi:bacteriorhodopsin